jgi:hypothetical protein
LASGLLVTLSGSAAAQTVTMTGPDRVTVRAEAVPLGQLLTELSKLLPMEKVEIDDAQESLPVTLAVDAVPIRVAMLLTLRASGLDFLLTERQLWVGTTPKISDSARDTTPAPQVQLGPQPNQLALDVDRLTTPARTPVPPPSDSGQRDVDHPLGFFAGSQPRAADTAQASAQGDAAAAPGRFAAEPVSEFDHMLPVRNVPFVVQGDSAVITEPGFVPYRNRPEVQRLRLATDVSTIP